jgi:hypothetical protein
MAMGINEREDLRRDLNPVSTWPAMTSGRPDAVAISMTHGWL